MHTIHHPGQHDAAGTSPKRRDAFGLSKPVLLWAMVMAVTLLSFYVHLLNTQMARAQALHAAPHAGAVQARAEPRRAQTQPAQRSVSAQAEHVATVR